MGCACCGDPLAACWSTGRSRRYAYYLCDTRGCAESRKSFRKEKLEGESDTLLTELVPTKGVFNVAFVMLSDLWNEKLASTTGHITALQGELREAERKIDQLRDRIVAATGDCPVAAYEKRIRELEMQKATTQEKIASCGAPRVSFGETYRTAFDFLGNPWKLWRSECLEDHRAVLRLVFSGRLAYARNEGYRTAKSSIPFKMIGDFKMRNEETGGARRNRTADLLNAIQALSQLSYGPTGGLAGFPARPLCS